MIKKKVPHSEGHIFFMRYDINRPFSLSRNGFKVSLVIIINISNFKVVSHSVAI
jgi:hypothetical protein